MTTEAAAAESPRPVPAAADAAPASTHIQAPAALPSRSLVHRLTVLNLQVLSLTLVITFSLIALSGLIAARERQAGNAALSAQLLANNLAPMMVFEDQAAARAELSALGQRADLLEIQISDRSGKLFAHWPQQTAPQTQERAVVSPAQGRRAGGQVLTELHLNEIRVFAPIRFKGEVQGLVMLRESLSSLHQNTLHLLGLAAVMIAAAILLASRVLRRVQRKALAPIVALAALAEQVARDQDYSRRAPVHRRDEVGRLTERFNQLLKRIEIWQAELNQQLRREQASGQEMQHLAHHDSLTQLPNRHHFQEAIKQMVASSLTTGQLAALMFIDLDHFKTVNDLHGHAAGDAVLRELSQRMSKVLRSGDQLCRLGGDEFALLLPAVPDSASVEQLAERLVSVVREPLWVQGQVMPVGVSIGMAFVPLDAQDAAQLLHRADLAMYAAKHAGRNTFRRARDEDATR